MRRIQIAIFFLGVALMAAPLSAQITSGGISGRVTDETGGIIPGVEILLTNVGTEPGPGVPSPVTRALTSSYFCSPATIPFGRNWRDFNRCCVETS